MTGICQERRGNTTGMTEEGLKEGGCEEGNDLGEEWKERGGCGGQRKKEWGYWVGGKEQTNGEELKWVRGAGRKREERGLGASTRGQTTPPQNTSGSDHTGTEWGWGVNTHAQMQKNAPYIQKTSLTDVDHMHTWTTPIKNT